MWERIEVLSAGIEEVRENMNLILISHYEILMARLKKGISYVFKTFNKLINKLQLNGKTYTTEKQNTNFFLIVPNHLEPRINSLWYKDLTKIYYDVLYGVLKTHKLELLQKRAIQSS